MKAKVILEASYEDFKEWQQSVFEIDRELPSLEEFKERCIDYFFADRNDYLDKDYVTVYIV